MRWMYAYGRGFRLSPVETLILFLLKKRPMYGYEIIKELRDRLGDLWIPKTGTIYPALRRLEMRGFIKTELMDDKEVYKLTELGEEALNASLEWLEADLKLINRFPFLLPHPYRHILMRRLFRGYRGFGRLMGILPYLIDEGMDIMDKEEYLRYLKNLRGYLSELLDDIERRIDRLEGGGKGEEK